MIGAIIGDIVGSRFEWHNHPSKTFELFSEDCFFTDDTVMTMAICQALLRCQNNTGDLSNRAVESMQAMGRLYPSIGYGSLFQHWLQSSEPKPYGSYGNGSAMRVSGCAYAGQSLEEVKAFSQAVTEVTHNHPEGIKGAEAVAGAIFMARTGSNLKAIRSWIDQNYYAMDFTLDEIRGRGNTDFKATCQETVPQALVAFFESKDFEDAIRNAISLGGDSDTIAAMTGSVAEVYYGVPQPIRKKALSFLDSRLKGILHDFEETYPSTRYSLLRTDKHFTEEI